VPTAGEALVFPAGAPVTMTNDLPAGTTVGAMTFNDSYTLNGNALTVTGDWSFSPFAYFTCSAPLTLGANMTLGAANQSTYTGAVDVNRKTLSAHSCNTSFHGAFNGSGSIVLSFRGDDATSQPMPGLAYATTDSGPATGCSRN
jgi:hypothetical protein